MRDLARDLKKELQDRSVETTELINIPKQHFLILKRTGEHILTKIRWAYSYLRGPLNGDDLLKLEKPVATQSTKTFKGSGDVEVYCTLTDDKSRPARIVLEHSTDNGRSWKPCRVKSQKRLYASSPDGVKHTLVWDSVKDVGRRKVRALVRMGPGRLDQRVGLRHRQHERPGRVPLRPIRIEVARP